MGKVLVIGGSTGLTGAVCLAGQAALRVGAGLVTVGIPSSLAPVLASKLTEVMWVPLPDDGQGHLSLAALDLIRERQDWCDVTVLGPGISRTEEVQQLVRLLVVEGQRPIVLDADGLSAWEGYRDHLDRHQGDLILTPHPGEFARLFGMEVDTVQASRLESVCKAARSCRSAVALKGPFTAVSGPEGRCYVTPSVNSGLATAGSGDVLAGAIGGLWAQRLRQGERSATEAGCLGVYVHAWAGRCASLQAGRAGLCAGDLLPSLGRIVDELAQPDTGIQKSLSVLLGVTALRSEEEKWVP